MNKLVSIIIPVYNKQEYIADCLNSVINQTYKNLEILIIDNGSTDNSFEICKRFAFKDERIRLFTTINVGVGFARNVGIENSTGNYLQFVDADDILEKQYTEKLLTNIIKTKADLSICGYYQKIRNQNVGEVCFEKDTVFQADGFIDLLDKYKLSPLCGSPWNKIFKTSLIKDNNIRFRNDITFAEDLIFVIECISNVQIFSVIKDKLYCYLLSTSNSLSKSNKNNAIKIWQQKLIFFNTLVDFYKNALRIKNSESLLVVWYYELLYMTILDLVRTENCNFTDLCKFVSKNSKYDINKIKLYDNSKTRRYSENKDYNYSKRKKLNLIFFLFIISLKTKLIKAYLLLLYLMTFRWRR